MERALYGPEGFYRRERASAHFRTSVHASGRYAEAFARLLAQVDAGLGHPGRLDLVDVGAGCGSMLTRIARLCDSDLAVRLPPPAPGSPPPPPGPPPAVAWRPRP